MANNKQQPHRVRAERIKEISHNNPRDGLDHLNELSELILNPNSGVRFLATDALVAISTEQALGMRKITPVLMSRLDDESVNVRTNAMAVLFNVAAIYPQDFTTGTDLIVKSAKSDNDEERLIATCLLAKIALFRPDLVTPREEALQTLEDADKDELTDESNLPFITKEAYEGAVRALRGGDMASRPLNMDLVPVPRSTKLSKPANVAIHSYLLGLVFVWSGFIGLINLFRFVFRYRHYSGAHRVMMFFNDLKKFKFAKSWNRSVLYLRSSMWPTPAQFLPFLPGRKPISEDYSVQSPEYPDNWGIIARTVYERDEWTCNNCGCGGGPKGDNELHADHQEPRSKGGADHPNNLRVLCRECHEARHARIFE